MTDLRAIFGAVLRLPFAELVGLLGGTVHEHDDGVVAFSCPGRRCPAWQATASSADGLTWRCCRCRRTGTAYELVEQVLRNEEAVRRLAELVHA